MMMSRFSLAGVVALAATAMGGTNEKGLKFLEENKNKPGVITLPSGLQYKVLRKGSGTEHPTANSPCECHYEGKCSVCLCSELPQHCRVRVVGRGLSHTVE